MWKIGCLIAAPVALGLIFLFPLQIVAVLIVLLLVAGFKETFE